MNKALLCNRKWDTRDFPKVSQSWYGGREILQSFPSVKKVDFTVTCSSAGDWEGYFIQKLGNKCYVIVFSQENNWPNGGFTVYTNPSPIIEFDGDANEISEEAIISCMYETGE